jgi:hypothetical protein
MARIIENLLVEVCGCYTQRITDSWMGETIVYYNPVVCSKHW